MRVPLLVVAVMAATAVADIYMQYPRGSNDRLNEQNQNRDNDNRLFDSQNNAKGGYCYTLGNSRMSFYEGSILPIQWTVQHGCANPKLQCNMVIQYMCGLQTEPNQRIQMRDGTTTTTIPNDNQQFNSKNSDGSYTYGMQESYDYYQACTGRQRNMGLFVADRVVGQNTLTGTTAVNTRQNNNGNQHGFECPEERDYYPYWHPSPWRDVAVLANDASQCKYYKAESQNVKEKGYCLDPATGVQAVSQNGAPNNPTACAAAGLTWTMAPAWNIPAPDCLEPEWSRDNHLGNVAGFGQTASYNWTMPTASEESCIKTNSCLCVLRIRYNISTADIDGWGFDDIKNSGVNSPVTQDPYYYVAGENVSLALDTTQYGRTFQDRSFTFEIKSRPSNVKSYERIFNLGVRGKRGNIVQTYPATEYDFVPNQLTTRQGDYIHFQWTGCDDNPANNAGEGTDQTDRSNIVQIAGPAVNIPVPDSWYTKDNSLFQDPSLRYRMAHLDQTGCLTYSELKAANNNGNIEQDVRNCMKLNGAASPYFDGGLVQMNNTGQFFYMSSRNNNFSNRGQKATITVIPILPAWAIGIVSGGAALFVASGGVASAMFYANSHPHTATGASINNILAKLRM